MRLFVGLGNPGAEYEKTRHNIGWQVIDAMKEKWQGQVTSQPGKKFQAELWSHTNGDLLAKPQTFMNKSGQSVQAIVQFYKIEPDQVWVAHDDLDIQFGSYKIHFGKGPKIHNGLLSLYESLGTDQFWHVRIGVDNRMGDRSMPGSAYVLTAFTTDEQKHINQLLPALIQELET